METKQHPTKQPINQWGGQIGNQKQHLKTNGNEKQLSKIYEI